MATELLASKAFLDIDTQLAIGTITLADADSLKKRFADVWQAVQALADAEAEQAQKTSTCAQQLKDEQVAAESLDSKLVELAAEGAALEQERAALQEAVAQLEFTDNNAQADLVDARVRDAAGSALEPSMRAACPVAARARPRGAPCARPPPS